MKYSLPPFAALLLVSPSGAGSTRYAVSGVTPERDHPYTDDVRCSIARGVQRKINCVGDIVENSCGRYVSSALLCAAEIALYAVMARQSGAKPQINLSIKIARARVTINDQMCSYLYCPYTDQARIVVVARLVSGGGARLKRSFRTSERLAAAAKQGSN